MKRINILQHVPYETPGCIEEWIQSKSYEYRITKLYKGEPLPDISNIDWLIIMGGPMSVHDTKKYLWLTEEKRFIKQAIGSDKIVIGICLGAQLIAEALGGRVYQNDFKEIGWFPVTRTGTKTGSKLIAGFTDTETVFHWHGDTVELPEGAAHEFRSEACRTQSFTYGERVLALQFHLEVTPPLLEAMISNGKEELLPGKYIQDAEKMREPENAITRTNELMFSILDEFDRI